MNIEEIKQKVDSQLTDGGMEENYEEQSVRLLLFHLYVAICIYREMLIVQKNKAGYWFRVFKSTYSLTGFLKERKRKREKKVSPLNPSYKETASVVKEIAQKPRYKEARELPEMKGRKETFWNELLQYETMYDRQMILKFFYYWAEEVKGTDKMKWELMKSWNTKYRLAIWSKRSYETDDRAAAVRLERAKNGGKLKPAADAVEQQAIAAKRAEDNEKLEREIAENKAGAVSYEEYIRRKNKTTT